MNINLYDFDNTIYKGDSSTDFFFWCAMRYPSIYLNIPKIILAAIKHKFNIISKTEMKEEIFRFVKKVPDIDKEVKNFWEEHRCFIKDFYLEKDHKNDVIISASPEFLLEGICAELKVKKLIGSKVNKKTGNFIGKNCHGEEKVKRLKKEYEEFKVKESYSDSKSDIPILKLAKKAFYVKGDKIIPTKF